MGATTITSFNPFNRTSVLPQNNPQQPQQQSFSPQTQLPQSSQQISSPFYTQQISRANFKFLKLINSVGYEAEQKIWQGCNVRNSQEKFIIKQINKQRLHNNHRICSAFRELQLFINARQIEEKLSIDDDNNPYSSFSYSRDPPLLQQNYDYHQQENQQHFLNSSSPPPPPPFLLNPILYAFQDYQYCYMIQSPPTTPYYTFDYVLKHHTFTEEQTKYIIASLIQLYEYSHSMGYVLADLSPEHFIVEKSTGKLKLLQFFNPLPIDTIYPYDMIVEPPSIYSAPEILCKDAVLGESDFYTLGMFMLEMMVQKNVFWENMIERTMTMGGSKQQEEGYPERHMERTDRDRGYDKEIVGRGAIDEDLEDIEGVGDSREDESRGHSRMRRQDDYGESNNRGRKSSQNSNSNHHSNNNKSSHRLTRHQIMQIQIQIKKHHLPQGWNPEAADFLIKLLIKNPSYRLGRYGSYQGTLIGDIILCLVKFHPWIQNYNWDILPQRNGVNLGEACFSNDEKSQKVGDNAIGVGSAPKRSNTNSKSTKGFFDRIWSKEKQTKSLGVQPMKSPQDQKTKTKSNNGNPFLTNPYQSSFEQTPLIKTQRFIKMFESYHYRKVNVSKQSPHRGARNPNNRNPNQKYHHNDRYGIKNLMVDQQLFVENEGQLWISDFQFANDHRLDIHDGYQQKKNQKLYGKQSQQTQPKKRLLNIVEYEQYGGQ